jgi:hypothetical protein
MIEHWELGKLGRMEFLASCTWRSRKALVLSNTSWQPESAGQEARSPKCICLSHCFRPKISSASHIYLEELTRPPTIWTVAHILLSQIQMMSLWCRYVWAHGRSLDILPHVLRDLDMASSSRKDCLAGYMPNPSGTSYTPTCHKKRWRNE